jgi:hypothetical protein
MIEVAGIKIEGGMTAEERAKLDGTIRTVNHQCALTYAQMTSMMFINLLAHLEQQDMPTVNELPEVEQKRMLAARTDGMLSAFMGMGIVAGYVTREEMEGVVPPHVTPIWDAVRGIITTFEASRDVARMQAEGATVGEVVDNVLGSVKAMLTRSAEGVMGPCQCDKCRGKRKG